MICDQSVVEIGRTDRSLGRLTRVGRSEADVGVGHGDSRAELRCASESGVGCSGTRPCQIRRAGLAPPTGSHDWPGEGVSNPRQGPQGLIPTIENHALASSTVGRLMASRALDPPATAVGGEPRSPIPRRVSPGSGPLEATAIRLNERRLPEDEKR